MAVVVFDVLTIDEIRLSDYMRNEGHSLSFIRYGANNAERIQQPVINRLLSRAYRLKFSDNLQKSGIRSINTWSIVRNSDLKPRSKKLFQEAKLPTPEGLHLEDSFFTIDGQSLSLNEGKLERILTTIDRFGYPIVIKPTRGSRGLSVYDFQNRKQLVESLYEILSIYLSSPTSYTVPVAFYQNLQNAGTFIERKEPHALDLRVPVAKYKGASPEVLGCLARLGRDELQLAKNTAQGAIPVGVDPPPELREICIKAAESVASGSPAYVVGVDILPGQEDINVRQRVYSRVSHIAEAHRIVREQAKKTEEILRILQQNQRSPESVLRDPRAHREVEKMDLLFQYFREIYTTYELVEAISEYLRKARLLVTEINTRPDFGVNTHNVATDLLPQAYARAAQSMTE